MTSKERFETIALTGKPGDSSVEDSLVALTAHLLGLDRRVLVDPVTLAQASRR